MIVLASVLLAVPASPSEELPGDATQKLSELPDSYSVRYGFKNFNSDRLSVAFSIKKAELQAYEADWGYTQVDVDGVKIWLANARQAALKEATLKGWTQGRLDAATAGLQKEYKRRLKDALAARGFRVEPDNSVKVDMRALVRKNTPLLKPLVLDLDASVKRKGYDSQDIIGAATAMAQTALFYRQPPTVEGGKHTGGVLPPVSALIKGWGDCDSKSGLLASILMNYPSTKIIGISAPDHYLIGILGQPGKGDFFIEHEGLRYIVIEPAGPAWLPPGTVGDATLTLLNSADVHTIEPFFD